MFKNHFNLVSRLRMGGAKLLRPIYVSMTCTSKTLPYLPPLLTHVVYATSNIRTFGRQIALLCSHWCLIPALAPSFSKQYNTTCSLTLQTASRLKQVLPFISPTFSQGMESQVWVTNCRYRSGGKRLWPILGYGLLLNISLICNRQCHDSKCAIFQGGIFKVLQVL
jgi:hypothetical protein